MKKNLFLVILVVIFLTTGCVDLGSQGSVDNAILAPIAQEDSIAYENYEPVTQPLPVFTEIDPVSDVQPETPTSAPVVEVVVPPVTETPPTVDVQVADSGVETEPEKPLSERTPKERGFVLVCTRDKATGEPLYAEAWMPKSNIKMSPYNKDTCAMVPWAVEEVYFPPTQYHKGHGMISMDTKNEDWIIYVDIEKQD